VPHISWAECPSDILAGVDCGSVEVPLAYEPGNSTSAHGNETVTLFLARLNATGIANDTNTAGNESREALFFNPGGPGVAPSLLVAFGQVVANLGFSSDVRERYDIIGLDPRGVGKSSPVKCDPKIFNERIKTFVNNTSSYKALRKHNRRLGESCANLTGPLIDHLDATHVAKDHELVRRALGTKKFNYLGISYGSLYGQEYISLFPESVGRLALDGLIDHSQSEIATLLTEATAYEATLNKFFQWCDTNTTCALHGNDTKKAWDTVLSRADSKPIPAPGCDNTCHSNVTGEDIRYNAQSFLQFVDFSFSSNWGDLGDALVQALSGNATLLSSPLATDEISAGIDGSPISYLAIGCQDWSHRGRSFEDIELRLQAIRPFAPRTLGATQTYYYQSGCLNWPANTTLHQVSLPDSTDDAPPVLLVQSVYDPSCSIAWANGLREQLASGISITRNGTGHTSHFLLGETRDVIDKYLATGEMPKDGSVYQT
jgi:pimeloyl-ACP methyl ester carboxylesterase